MESAEERKGKANVCKQTSLSLAQILDAPLAIDSELARCNYSGIAACREAKTEI